MAMKWSRAQNRVISTATGRPIGSRKSGAELTRKIQEKKTKAMAKNRKKGW